MAGTGTEVQELSGEQVAIVTALLQRKGVLSPKEAELAVALVHRAGRLPRMHPVVFKGVFWGDGQVAPLPLMEGIFLDRKPNSLEELKRTRVLLSLRNDAHFHGRHHPGSYLGVRWSFEELARHVAKEFGGVAVHIIGFAGVINNGGLERDHEVAAVCIFHVRPEDIHQEGAAFYPVYELPPDILGHHRVIHQKGLDWLEFMLKLPTEELRTRFCELSVVTECLLPK